MGQSLITTGRIGWTNLNNTTKLGASPGAGPRRPRRRPGGAGWPGAAATWKLTYGDRDPASLELAAACGCVSAEELPGLSIAGVYTLCGCAGGPPGPAACLKSESMGSSGI